MDRSWQGRRGSGMAVELAGAERQTYVAVLELWDWGGNPDPVSWAGRCEQDRIEYLPELTQKAIKEALCDYARKGGKIARVDERRDDYKDRWKYHFDLWPTIEGKVYYFETRFDCSPDPDESVIYIMRFKPHRA